ncbi:hypothetical protein IFO70_39490 [Phormidium tenue FACHB-886]|nr:hypothetical protein [Phormidium tenue FACHB-886]
MSCPAIAERDPPVAERDRSSMECLLGISLRYVTVILATQKPIAKSAQQPRGLDSVLRSNIMSG